MVIILDILYKYHLGLFVPITTDWILSAVVKIRGPTHLALRPSYRDLVLTNDNNRAMLSSKVECERRR